jgi:hypothetical protein
MAENKLRLYRALLRGVRNYPSMKRGQYEQEIKTGGLIFTAWLTVSSVQRKQDTD